MHRDAPVQPPVEHCQPQPHTVLRTCLPAFIQLATHMEANALVYPQVSACSTSFTVYTRRSWSSNTHIITATHCRRRHSVPASIARKAQRHRATCTWCDRWRRRAQPSVDDATPPGGGDAIALALVLRGHAYSLTPGCCPAAGLAPRGPRSRRRRSSARARCAGRRPARPGTPPSRRSSLQRSGYVATS